MGDVHEVRVGRQRQDDALHRAGVVVPGSEVGEQGDDRSRHGLDLLRVRDGDEHGPRGRRSRSGG